MAEENPYPALHLAHGSHALEFATRTPEGFEIWICDVCHFLEAYCGHEKNSWNEDGTILTCDACGIDGT